MMSISKAAVALSLVFAPQVRAEVPTESIEAFLDLARGVVADVQSDTRDDTAIATAIDEMLEHAKPVVVAYGEKHTQCAAQLARVIELYPQINVWTAQEIRRNIEAGQQLPPAEGCYPARDIVAHPAIVRTFARAGIQAAQVTRLVREMNEAIEHMEGIAADLGE